jgi:hypothetical protein
MKEFKKYQAVANYNLESDKAIQLSFEWGNVTFSKIWFPKSQITFINKTDFGACEIQVAFWLLYKNKDKDNNLQNSNSNSTWCEVFQQQDSNGLSEYGYAL